jgi:hypothetical protein
MDVPEKLGKTLALIQDLFIHTMIGDSAKVQLNSSIEIYRNT